MSASASGSSAQANGSASNRGHKQGNQERTYTPAQKTEVIRIRRCSPTAYYEILAVQKTASDGEIKKAYRKISLLTHPDKNGYDGADEAFKMVSRAFQILSDSDKKARYDQFGGDPDNRFSSSGAAAAAGSAFSGFARSPGRGGPMFDDEISPEEVFNRFFAGGGFGGPFGMAAGNGFGGPQFVFNMGGGPGFRVHRMGGQVPRGRPRDAEERASGSGFAILAQLLPLLLLFVLPLLSSLLSGSGSSGPSVRYDSPLPPMTMHRVTPKYKIDYFINPAEVDGWKASKLRGLDQRAEVDYVSNLRYQCEVESQRKRQEIQDATGFFFTDEERLHRARAMVMPGCRRLDELRISRQSSNFDTDDGQILPVPTLRPPPAHSALAHGMSEPLSDADKVGQTYLVALHEPPVAQAMTPRPEGAQDEPPVSAPKPAISIAPPRMPSPCPATGSSVTPQKREMNGVEKPSRLSTRPAETIEEFEDRSLRAAFRLTLDADQTKDAVGNSLYAVPDLRQELEAEGKHVRLSVDVLEQAIIEAARSLGSTKTTPHDWLFGCWKRVNRHSRSLKDRTPSNARWVVLQEARRLCLSWCIFSVTLPDMFGLEYDGTAALADHLLAGPDDDGSVDQDFLTEAVARFDQDDSIAAVFVAAIEEHSRRLAAKTMDSDYQRYTAVLRQLVRFKPLGAAIAESSIFVDSTLPASGLETKTLLGPYFALSPLQSEVSKQYFVGPKTMDPTRIRGSQQALQLALRAHQTALSEIVNPLLRASDAARSRVLDWFALSVNANHRRRAMRIDMKTVSSDGFMINVNTVLNTLCEPFMDATFSKISRVEVEYLHRRPRVDVKDETKINADQEASDAFYNATVEGQNNFISECFFLTVAAHHYGTEAARNRLKDMDRELKHMNKQIEQFETDRHKYVNNPMQLQMFDNALRKYKDQYDSGLAYKYTIQGVLLDELTQARSMQFMRFVTVWLLRQVSPHAAYPSEPLVLPLPEDEPERFAYLPEYFLDIISGNFGFILYNLPQVISQHQSEELIMLCITFLRNSEYIKNPYLKASLVTILFRGTWTWRQGGAGILAGQYNGMDFARKNLLHSLMKFFIEAEFMGGHGQFFDKFNVRFEIFQVIKCIWPNTVYRDQLSREAKVNTEFFVRFVNLLLNDVTFVLDESFTAFHTIHELSRELALAGTTLNEEQRGEKEEALEAAKGKAKSYMQLTNETVAMLKLFTEALADAFTMPEIVQRLADMLDYNLDAMVGPKRESLKVENLQEYNFNPRALLSEIVDVYLNLMNKDNFILAVARDGRSYKPANFAAAARILKEKMLKSAEELVKWRELVDKIAKAKQDDDNVEAELGDIPDDFLDPLMYTLMEDPVILPVSRTIIDRSTIRSHLLSDPHDPFNRVPLKIEDVIPATEMKQKIELFKEERIGAKRKDFVETVKTEDTEPALIQEMAILDHFEVQVIVDGKAANEYDDDTDDAQPANNAPNTLTKYVEAVSGKTFQFRICIHPGIVWANADCFVARPYLEGYQHKGCVLQKPDMNTMLSPVKLILNGDWSGSESNMKWYKYRFVDLVTRDTTNDDDSSKMKDLYGQLGLLKIQLWRERILLRNPAPKSTYVPKLHLPGSVPEKALKGNPINIATTLEPDTSIHPPVRIYETAKVDLLPAATFIFKYRTRKALQSLMIIPRSPSPLPVHISQPPTIKQEGSSNTKGFKRERSLSFSTTTSEPRRRWKTSRLDGKVVYHIDDILLTEIDTLDGVNTIPQDIVAHQLIRLLRPLQHTVDNVSSATITKHTLATQILALGIRSEQVERPYKRGLLLTLDGALPVKPVLAPAPLVHNQRIPHGMQIGRASIKPHGNLVAAALQALSMQRLVHVPDKMQHEAQALPTRPPRQRRIEHPRRPRRVVGSVNVVPGPRVGEGGNVRDFVGEQRRFRDVLAKKEAVEHVSG
ncbi:hypothetical protein DV736_g3364, partial [Chaetothyriales sp. CBS 134916]